MAEAQAGVLRAHQPGSRERCVRFQVSPRGERPKRLFVVPSFFSSSSLFHPRRVPRSPNVSALALTNSTRSFTRSRSQQARGRAQLAPRAGKHDPLARRKPSAHFRERRDLRRRDLRRFSRQARVLLSLPRTVDASVRRQRRGGLSARAPPRRSAAHAHRDRDGGGDRAFARAAADGGQLGGVVLRGRKGRDEKRREEKGASSVREEKKRVGTVVAGPCVRGESAVSSAGGSSRSRTRAREGEVVRTSPEKPARRGSRARSGRSERRVLRAR